MDAPTGAEAHIDAEQSGLDKQVAFLQDLGAALSEPEVQRALQAIGDAWTEDLRVEERYSKASKELLLPSCDGASSSSAGAGACPMELDPPSGAELASFLAEQFPESCARTAAAPPPLSAAPPCGEEGNDRGGEISGRTCATEDLEVLVQFLQEANSLEKAGLSRI